MRSIYTRRNMLQHATAAIGVAVTAGRSSGADRMQPADPVPAPMSAYPYERNIWVRVNGRTFTCYRAGAHQKLPYIYPILAPASGLPMTEEAGDPYPHHRSLYLGCDRVNGHNFWQEGIDRGQIVSRGPQLTDTGPECIVIRDTCDWRAPDQPPVIEDHRTFTFTGPTPDVRLIDTDITLTAQTDVHITKTNHSLFALRAARDLTPATGGTLFNDQGQQGEKATLGQKARWCGFTNTRLGRAESIILMDHPDNPWSPCPWFTRDYGFISPTPFYWFDDNGWSLSKGKSVRLRYRVLAAAGSAALDAAESWYRHWTRR